MKSNIRRVQDRKASSALSVAVGTVVAVGISLAMTCGITSLILRGNMGMNGVSVALFAVRALSVLVGCLVGTGLYKEKMLIVLGAVAGGYLLLITATGVLIFDGSVKHLLIGVLSVALGGGVACFIRLSVQKKPRYAVRNRG